MVGLVEKTETFGWEQGKPAGCRASDAPFLGGSLAVPGPMDGVE